VCSARSAGWEQRPRRLNPALLDRVPVIEFDLDLPDERQRRLYEAFYGQNASYSARSGAARYSQQKTTSARQRRGPLKAVPPPVAG
jgi:hypothetical protein